MTLTIGALEDGAQEGMEFLGTLHGVKGAPAKTLHIAKKVTIPGVGSYRKVLDAPLYSQKVMKSWPGQENQARRCHGIVAKRGARSLGYVSRQMGSHTVALAVYDPALFSPVGWRIRGFLPTGEGYVAVAAPRVGYWVWLALAALVVFGVSFGAFVLGPAQAWQMLLETAAELPQTLTDLWFRLLHSLGLA